MGETHNGRHARDELDMEVGAVLMTAAPAVVIDGISTGFWPHFVSSRSLVTRASSSGESPCLQAQLGSLVHFSPRL